MSEKYADISVVNFSDDVFLQVIEDESTVRLNNAQTRGIIKWTGPDPDFVAQMGLTVRTQSEALAYYSDPVNGWVE